MVTLLPLLLHITRMLVELDAVAPLRTHHTDDGEETLCLHVAMEMEI